MWEPVGAAPPRGLQEIARAVLNCWTFHHSKVSTEEQESCWLVCWYTRQTVKYLITVSRMTKWVGGPDPSFYTERNTRLRDLHDLLKPFRLVLSQDKIQGPEAS